MDLLPFSQVQSVLLDEERYGQLCDLYALNATPVDWGRTVRTAAEHCRVEFGVDGAYQPIPDDLFPLLHFDYNAPDAPIPHMAVHAGPLTLSCTFLCRDEIEMNFERRTLTTEGWAALQGFMRVLGRRLSRDVLLTAESDSSTVLVRFDVRADRLALSGFE